MARAAGVSKMTASRVLRGEGGYSEKTRALVLEKVDKFGYVPNRLTTVFAGDQSSAFIGVSIPDLGNEVFAQVLEGIDHFDSGFDMGRYLIGCGYTNLGYVGTSHDTANAAATHLDGFCKAVKGCCGSIVKQLCLHNTATYYLGYYGTEQLLASTSSVECIFCQNDAMAFGGLQFCHGKGLAVPKDIDIAGWGDLPIASVITTRLTSMHVPHLKLGQAAAEMMMGRLLNEPVLSCHDIRFRLIPGSTVRIQS